MNEKTALYESVERLYNTIEEKECPEDAELLSGMVKNCLRDCADYVHTITTMSQRIQMARFTMESEDYRQFVMSLDTQRRFEHNSLMGGVDSLNRICRNYGINPIAEVNVNDRTTYGDFAMAVVQAYFPERLAS